MNIEQAKRAMRKLFGDKAMWRYDERAPKAEERDRIRETLPTLREASKAAKAARDARHAELLKDPEYLRLFDEAKAADDAHKRAISMTSYYRVTIGKNLGFAFEVVAQGDNWQEAIDAARAKVKS